MLQEENPVMNIHHRYMQSVMCGIATFVETAVEQPLAIDTLIETFRFCQSMQNCIYCNILIPVFDYYQITVTSYSVALVCVVMRAEDEHDRPTVSLCPRMNV